MVINLITEFDVSNASQHTISRVTVTNSYSSSLNYTRTLSSSILQTPTGASSVGHLQAIWLAPSEGLWPEALPLWWPLFLLLSGVHLRASFEMSMFLLQSTWPIQRHLGLTRAIRMSSCYVSLKGLLLEIFLGQKIFKIVNYIDVFRFTCFTSGSRKLIEAFYLVPNCRFKVQNAEINLPTQNADSSSKDMILHTNM